MTSDLMLFLILMLGFFLAQNPSTVSLASLRTVKPKSLCELM